MYNLLDLFSGIGGFSLGLERSGGFKTVAFCEIESFCCKVLKKHWPEVPIYDDIRTLTASKLAGDGIAVDAICGGFPCQDISVAGKGAGIDGARSGLWSEYARLVGELRPKYVIVENVAALLGRGLERVLGDLAALRYDAEWHCIPASAVGAPHRRDRIWILSYPTRTNDAGETKTGWAPLKLRECYSRIREPIIRTAWGIEPNMDRVAYGVPASVDRVASLGNAVVPQIPEMIGRAIMADEQKPEPA